MRAISIRIEPVRVGKRGWVSHDFRLKIPEYAAPTPPPGGRLVLLHGHQPRPDLTDLAEEVRQARAAFQHLGGRPPHPAWGGILTLGHDAQRDIHEGRVRLEDLDHAALTALHDLFGTSLVYVVRHRDEAAPHFHFLIRNCRPQDGRAWRFSRTDLSKLQDRTAAHFHGFGWTRGRRKEDRLKDGEPVSRWTHRRVSELHQSLLLDRERAEAARYAAERQKADAQQEREEATRLKEEATRVLARARAEAHAWQQRADALRRDIAAYEAKLRELSAAEDQLRKQLAQKEHALTTIAAAIAKAERDRDRHTAEIGALEERQAEIERAIAREKGRLKKVRKVVAEEMGEEADNKGMLPVSRAQARRWAKAAVAKALEKKEDEIHRLTVERDAAREELEKLRMAALQMDRKRLEAEEARRAAENERRLYRAVLAAVSGEVASPQPIPEITARVRQLLANARERQAWAEAGLWWDTEREAIRAASMTRKAAATALYAARKLGWSAVLCRPPEWAQIVAEEAERRGIAIQVQALDPNGKPTVLWSPPNLTPLQPDADPSPGPGDPKPF